MIFPSLRNVSRSLFSAFMITKKRDSVNLWSLFVIKYVILFLTDLQRFIAMPEIQDLRRTGNCPRKDI